MFLEQQSYQSSEMASDELSRGHLKASISCECVDYGDPYLNEMAILDVDIHIMTIK